MLRLYTELEIERLAQQLLSTKPQLPSRLPIDVELLLESQPGVVLKVVPGMMARFSVHACVCRSADQQTTLVYVDRAVSDSRTEWYYREILAEVLGHMTLHAAVLDQTIGIDDYLALRSSPEWPRIARDVRRFALGLLAPEELVEREADAAYRRLVVGSGHDRVVAYLCLFFELERTFCTSRKLILPRMLRRPCDIRGRLINSMTRESPRLLGPDSAGLGSAVQLELFAHYE